MVSGAWSFSECVTSVLIGAANSRTVVQSKAWSKKLSDRQRVRRPRFFTSDSGRRKYDPSLAHSCLTGLLPGGKLLPIPTERTRGTCSRCQLS